MKTFLRVILIVLIQVLTCLNLLMLAPPAHAQTVASARVVHHSHATIPDAGCNGDNCDNLQALAQGCAGSGGGESQLNDKAIFNHLGTQIGDLVLFRSTVCRAMHASIHFNTSHTILLNDVETHQTQFDAEVYPCFGNPCPAHFTGNVWRDAGMAGLTAGQQSCFFGHSDITDETVGETSPETTNNNTFCFTG